MKSDNLFLTKIFILFFYIFPFALNCNERTRISLSSDIKVKNKADLVVYAATYYKKRLFGFECKKWGATKIFEPTTQAFMERPPLDMGYDRKLIVSTDPMDLKQKLSQDEYGFRTSIPIGNFKGEKFYIVARGDALLGYNQIQWKLLKPFIDILSQTTDVILDRVIKKVVKHEYMNNPATVRVGNDLPKEERIFLEKRQKRIKAGIENILGRSISKNQIPNIAFCLSGGGFRGMIASIGCLLGAKEIGLLDVTSYVSALSGSSLFLAPWIVSGYRIEKFFKKLRKSVKKDFFTPFINYKELSEEIIKKILFKQNISLIDLWGFLLANRLLDMFKDKRHDISFTQFSKAFYDGKMPFPLHVAAHASRDYKWFEFSPFEVGSSYLGAYIPSWAFGRRFLNGESQDFAPGQSLGYMLGIFGAALSANFREILLELRKKLQKKSRFNIADFITTQTSIGDIRVFPAKVFNFTYGMHCSIARDLEEFTFVDAGLDFALPFPPLLRPERKLDIIIVSDNSNTVQDYPSLKKAEQYAREKKLRFPIIDYDKIENKKFIVFKDDDPEIPVVIYFPLIKNESYSKVFDPEKEKEGFCSMYNFQYTNEQFDLLSGLTKFNMLDSREAIFEVIREVVARKNR